MAGGAAASSLMNGMPHLPNNYSTRASNILGVNKPSSGGGVSSSLAGNG